MARDNSPKERQHKQLERKQGRRTSYDHILIVSEGSKTEPNYFREIRAAYRLHTANVEVWPSKLGTAPIQVVQYAQQLFESGDRHKNVQRRAFEKVYAAFDRDDHDSYFDALRLAESLDGKLRNDAKQPVAFQAVASVPSFAVAAAPLRRHSGSAIPRRSDAPPETTYPWLRERFRQSICNHQRTFGRRQPTRRTIGGTFYCLHGSRAFYRHCRTGGAADHTSQLNFSALCEIEWVVGF